MDYKHNYLDNWKRLVQRMEIQKTDEENSQIPIGKKKIYSTPDEYMEKKFMTVTDHLA